MDVRQAHEQAQQSGSDPKGDANLQRRADARTKLHLLTALADTKLAESECTLNLHLMSSQFLRLCRHPELSLSLSHERSLLQAIKSTDSNLQFACTAYVQAKQIAQQRKETKRQAEAAKRTLCVLSRQHTLACLALLRCRALARCFLSPLVESDQMQFEQEFSEVLKTAKQLATEAMAAGGGGASDGLKQFVNSYQVTFAMLMELDIPELSDDGPENVYLGLPQLRHSYQSAVIETFNSNADESTGTMNSGSLTKFLEARGLTSQSAKEESFRAIEQFGKGNFGAELTGTANSTILNIADLTHGLSNELAFEEFLLYVRWCALHDPTVCMAISGPLGVARAARIVWPEPNAEVSEPDLEAKPTNLGEEEAAPALVTEPIVNSPAAKINTLVKMVVTSGPATVLASRAQELRASSAVDDFPLDAAITSRFPLDHSDSLSANESDALRGLVDALPQYLYPRGVRLREIPPTTASVIEKAKANAPVAFCFHVKQHKGDDDNLDAHRIWHGVAVHYVEQVSAKRVSRLLHSTSDAVQWQPRWWRRSNVVSGDMEQIEEHSSPARVTAPRAMLVPKCLAILSEVPMYGVLRDLARQLLRIALSSNSSDRPLPFSRYVANVIHDVPAPLPVAETDRSGDHDSSGADVAYAPRGVLYRLADRTFRFSSQEIPLYSRLRKEYRSYHERQLLSNTTPRFRANADYEGHDWGNLFEGSDWASLFNALGEDDAALAATLLLLLKPRLQSDPGSTTPGVDTSNIADDIDASMLVDAVAAILGEARVVVCTRHLALLTPVCRALLSLVLPFRWQWPFVPLLPYRRLRETILSRDTTPFLVGVHTDDLESLMEAESLRVDAADLHAPALNSYLDARERSQPPLIVLDLDLGVLGQLQTSDAKSSSRTSWANPIDINAAIHLCEQIEAICEVYAPQFLSQTNASPPEPLVEAKRNRKYAEDDTLQFSEKRSPQYLMQATRKQRQRLLLNADFAFGQWNGFSAVHTTTARDPAKGSLPATDRAPPSQQFLLHFPDIVQWTSAANYPEVGDADTDGEPAWSRARAVRAVFLNWVGYLLQGYESFFRRSNTVRGSAGRKKKKFDLPAFMRFKARAHPHMNDDHSTWAASTSAVKSLGETFMWRETMLLHVSQPAHPLVQLTRRVARLGRNNFTPSMAAKLLADLHRQPEIGPEGMVLASQAHKDNNSDSSPRRESTAAVPSSNDATSPRSRRLWRRSARKSSLHTVIAPMATPTSRRSISAVDALNSNLASSLSLPGSPKSQRQSGVNKEDQTPSKLELLSTSINSVASGPIVLTTAAAEGDTQIQVNHVGTLAGMGEEEFVMNEGEDNEERVVVTVGGAKQLLLIHPLCQYHFEGEELKPVVVDSPVKSKEEQIDEAKDPVENSDSGSEAQLQVETKLHTPTPAKARDLIDIIIMNPYGTYALLCLRCVFIQSSLTPFQTCFIISISRSPQIILMRKILLRILPCRLIVWA